VSAAAPGPAAARSACGPVGATRALVDSAAARLRQSGVEDPRREAELLLAHVLGVPRAELVAGLAGQAVDGAQAGTFESFVDRRVAREPFAYITGRKGFRHIELAVDSRVLIPRPETELLVAAALVDRPCGVLDVATGSGAVALALAAELPDGTVDAVDISEDALAVARANAERLGLAKRTRFWRSDLLSEVADRYDCIVANLPYVPSGDLQDLQPEITRYEPAGALDGGRDGLDLIRRLVNDSPGHFKPGGLIALEIGDGQGQATAALLRDAGFVDTDVQQDLSGQERVVTGRWA
jgi:release factor glutamine methyltransferase